MAFTVTKFAGTVFGDRRVAYGKYVNDSGSTGGDITTGLQLVEGFYIQPKGSAVLANQPVVNETLPLVATPVTIVTTADETGYWYAFGK